MWSLCGARQETETPYRKSMHTSSSSLSRTCCCTARLGGAHREPQARAHRPRGNATPSLFASTCCGTCHIDIDCVRLGRHALRAWAGRDVRLCARNVPADGPQKRGRMYTAAWPVGPTRFVQHSYKYNVVFIRAFRIRAGRRSHEHSSVRYVHCLRRSVTIFIILYSAFMEIGMVRCMPAAVVYAV